MADLPLIQLPMPEEEQPLTLYARITNTNEPPKYDDIQNSDLPKEEKIRQIQYRTKAYQDDLDRQLHKDYARIGLGGLVSAIGALPIAITKNPVIGSAIGGGVYELGQGIMEGDEFPELMQRSEFGTAIGGAAGGVVSKAPQAAKFVNDLSGGKIGNALKPIGDKITNSKLYDALMTDIRAFNPNKQTVYHGSPYDFEKFSNEAIGTGEGAQAHGYGHYAALDKDTAEAYAKNLSEGNKVIEYNGKIYKSNAEFKPNEYNYKMLSDVKTDGLEAAKNFYKDQEQWAREKLAKSNDKKWWEDTVKAAEGTNRLLDTVNPNLISDIRPDTGQLYKLSVPKDDVMLREDASLIEQPEQVQRAIEKMYADAAKRGDMKLAGIFGSNGKETYRDLSKYFNSQEKANQYLNDYGIKGISYNGGIDGEARVIFNPDDIVIGRKYYNQPNLYQQLTGKQNTGALADSIEDKINPGDLINTFFNINGSHIEDIPPLYTGERDINEVIDYIGNNGNIKTPIDTAILNKNNLYHYLFENNPERLEDLNKVIRTFQEPNLIIKGQRYGNDYNYYAKPFKHKGQVRGHLNITRNKPNGNFYQTNFSLRGNKLWDLLNEGQVIYNNLPRIDSTHIK